MRVYLIGMSPTVFRIGRYRFYFFSREEDRKHVHVYSPDGEAKFWIEPSVELAVSKGLKDKEIGEIYKIVEDRIDEIRDSWNRHFPG